MACFKHAFLATTPHPPSSSLRPYPNNSICLIFYSSSLYFPPTSNYTRRPTALLTPSQTLTQTSFLMLLHFLLLSHPCLPLFYLLTYSPSGPRPVPADRLLIVTSLIPSLPSASPPHPLSSSHSYFFNHHPLTPHLSYYLTTSHPFHPLSAI